MFGVTNCLQLVKKKSESVVTETIKKNHVAVIVEKDIGEEQTARRTIQETQNRMWVSIVLPNYCATEISEIH